MSPSWKQLAFALLVAQNTALSVASKFSRLYKYHPGTAIFLVEVIKCICCIGVLCKLRGGNIKGTIDLLHHEVLSDYKGLQKMTGLAILYAMQNIGSLIAYDYVDIATYQIVYQLKIITTAFFMRILLQRKFTFIQWCAMCTLMSGVAACSYARVSVTTNDNHSLHFYGISMVGLLAVNSGLAAAYFESVIKSHRQKTSLSSSDSFWIRNTQLALISVLATSLNLSLDASLILKHGLFHEIQPIVWLVIFLQAFGGIIVAAVVRYSDNIIKNFGTSLSLVLSCLISNYLSNSRGSPLFYSSILMVVVSVLIYGDKRFAFQQPNSELVKTAKNHISG
uniref:UDPNacetylglucosamine transporter putative n=1 Tax=Albugo laibachii Nc14 TaxID=890382 RepID=F0WDG7_9STRA|nr:UDPNacetylglucosamine transporter putative [Albugo laibachii Nc14]|eukprot:CCA19239.1 UDPNacetylglucosamine transporter putative [Albugo laibachii Nc14]